MSVSAAELPAMSSAASSDKDFAQQLQARLNLSLRRIAFLVVPSSMAFLALGSGGWSCVPNRRVHPRRCGLLMGYPGWLRRWTLGFDPRATVLLCILCIEGHPDSPEICSLASLADNRVGILCALPLPPAIGLSPKWGVAGLTVSAGLAGWLEFAFLRRSLNRRIGEQA